MANSLFLNKETRQATASYKIMTDKLGLRARNREVEVLKCFEKKKERLSPSDDLHLGRWDVEKLTEIEIDEIAVVFRDLRAAGYLKVTPGYEQTSSFLYDLTEEGQALLDSFIEVKPPEILESAESLYEYIRKYFDPNTHHWSQFSMTQYRPEHQARFIELLEELKARGVIEYHEYGRSMSVNVLQPQQEESL